MPYTPHARKSWIDVGRGHIGCRTDYGTQPIGDVDDTRLALGAAGDLILPVLEKLTAMQKASRLPDCFDEPINLLDAALAAVRHDEGRLEQDVGDTMDEKGLG